MERFMERIGQSATQMLATEKFQEWAEERGVRSGDKVWVNNSFLLRRDLQLRTRKNPQYLVLTLGRDGSGFFAAQTDVAVPDEGINVVFRKVDSEHDLQLSPLRPAVEAEIRNFGRLIMSLIGPIRTEASRVDINDPENPYIRGLVVDASGDVLGQDDVMVVDGDIYVRDLRSVEQHWQRVQPFLQRMGVDDTGMEAFAPVFDDAYNRLRAVHKETVQIPGTVRDLERNAKVGGGRGEIAASGGVAALGGVVAPGGPDTIMSRFVASLAQELQTYTRMVDEFSRTGADFTYHEVLRIAYNFAEDLGDVLRLIVGLCDLKPILFWLTGGRQLQLLEVFHRELPWHAVRRKPSLSDYRNTIGEARNNRFRRLLSFPADLVVDLEHVPIQARSLRMFTPQRGPGSRGRRAAGDIHFDYEEREIVELLQTFTRTPEHQVATTWWARNAKVMEATLALVRAFEDGLTELARTSLDAESRIA